MFKDVQNPKGDEMFKFAVTIVISLVLIVTAAASYGISSLI